jgi:hypothetical protein
MTFHPGFRHYRSSLPLGASRTSGVVTGGGEAEPFSVVVDIGAATSGRRVVLVVHLSDWYNPAPPTITIAGVPATVHATPPGAPAYTTIVSAVVPTGTTAVVAFTDEIAPYYASVVAYRLVNAQNQAPHDIIQFTTASDVTTASGQIDIPEGGCLIAGVSWYDIANTNWSGATESYDDAAGYSGTLDSGLTAQTNRTVSASFSPATATSLSAVSWR